MYSVLNPGVIGVSARGLDATIAAARTVGFQGIEVDGSEIADLVDRVGTEAVKDKFARAEIIPGAFGLPVEWRKTCEELSEELTKLERVARACASIGCPRTFTWIMPCSDERDYAENRKFHLERLSQVARVLYGHSCTFGLEFIGPKTLRDSQRYPFIYQMGPMLELAQEMGPNVGLMIDCWHWHTSGGTVADLERLEARDVVDVHVNDAPAGVPTDELIDSVRSVPASTGVIDAKGFMRALQKIGYEGPITPEPFTSELAGLPSDAERLRVVAEGVAKLFSYLN